MNLHGPAFMPAHAARLTRRAACLRAATAGSGLMALGLPAKRAQASTSSAAVKNLANARRQGQGVLRYLGLKIYDATLWTQPGFEPTRWQQHPFLLELRYARSLKGQDIAQRSLEAMQRFGALDEGTGARWLESMRRAFPDVLRDDWLTGQWNPATQTTRFASRAAETSIEDRAFGLRFFGIWFDERTSEPGLRADLLGLRSTATGGSS